MMWATVLATAAGCYLLKLVGLSLPPRWLRSAPLQRVAALVPVALLAALVAVQSFSDGRAVVLDARARGLAAAALAIALRAPFLVVVAVAAIATAAARALG